MTEAEKPKKTVKAKAQKEDAGPAAHKKSSKKQSTEKGYSAVGRRKTAIARVTLFSGSGAININGKDHETYVSGRHRLLAEILKPFAVVNLKNIYDVEVKANGGGIASQAEAVKLGIARALLLIDPAMKPALSKAGCLVRDSRMKERKKYGRKRARKRFQFSKR
jgi:small subunit ribosomal protein S9